MAKKTDSLTAVRESLRLLTMASVDPDDWGELDAQELQAQVKFYAKVEEETRKTLQSNLKLCAKKLLSPKWARLASDGTNFKAELESVLRASRVSLQLLHGVRANRPTANDKRDHDIFEIWWKSKTNSAPDTLSFGQIAIKYNAQHKPRKPITASTVERACKRLEKRNQELFGRIIALAHLKTHLRDSSNPVLSKPPTPYSILAADPKEPQPPFLQAMKTLYAEQGPWAEVLAAKIQFAPFAWWEGLEIYDDPSL